MSNTKKEWIFIHSINNFHLKQNRITLLIPDWEIIYSMTLEWEIGCLIDPLREIGSCYTWSSDMWWDLERKIHRNLAVNVHYMSKFLLLLERVLKPASVGIGFELGL